MEDTLCKNQLDSLQKDFTHSIDRDMEVFKKEISSFLAERFMQRYYYLGGVIEYKAGAVTMTYPDNQGVLSNASYVAEFEGRNGVLHLNGEGAGMNVSEEVLQNTRKKSPEETRPALEPPLELSWLWSGARLKRFPFFVR